MTTNRRFRPATTLLFAASALGACSLRNTDFLTDDYGVSENPGPPGMGGGPGGPGGPAGQAGVSGNEGGGGQGTAGTGDGAHAGSGLGPGGTGGTSGTAGAGEGGGGASGGAGGMAPLTNDPPSYVTDGSPTFCTGKTETFCEDFDTKPLPGGFTIQDGTDLSLTTTLAKSKPNTLMLTVPGSASIGTFGSKLGHTFTGADATSINFEFDMYPQLVDTTSGNGVLFAAVEFTQGAAKYSLRLAHYNGAARIEESTIGTAGDDILHNSFPVTLGVWSHVRLAISLAGLGAGGAGGATTSPYAEVYVDDKLQNARETLTVPAAIMPVPTLLLGAIFGRNPTTGWAFRFDDVTFDVH